MKKPLSRKQNHRKFPNHRLLFSEVHAVFRSRKQISLANKARGRMSRDENNRGPVIMR